jgi:hypothetical protein
MDQKLDPDNGALRIPFTKTCKSVLKFFSRACRGDDSQVDRTIYAARALAYAWMLRWQHKDMFDRALRGLLQLTLDHKNIDLSQLPVDKSFELCTVRESADT